ncbi:hypothetical protein [Trinickia mobilis]|uniref:hypothetical protein n=1 Tax=Trinickia mobilis TaxID=2816356 RepID=UPI001A8CC02C|nr:hypothetical protein [Trinickia mobilis]
MEKTVLARIGAVFFVIWGLAHFFAAYQVYQTGLAGSPSLVQGRLFQEAFYIFAFATTGIVLAIKLNWRNSRAGFWVNALIIGIGDVPFILFVLIPGYAPFWPGILGPVLWIAGMIFTGLGQKRPIRLMQGSQ